MLRSSTMASTRFYSNAVFDLKPFSSRNFVWTLFLLRCFDFCCQISVGGSRRETPVNCKRREKSTAALRRIPAPPQEYGFDGFRFGGVTSMLPLVKMGYHVEELHDFEGFAKKMDQIWSNEIASEISMMRMYIAYMYYPTHLCHIVFVRFMLSIFHQVSLPWNWKAFWSRLSSAWISERKSVTRRCTSSYTFHGKKHWVALVSAATWTLDCTGTRYFGMDGDVECESQLCNWKMQCKPQTWWFGMATGNHFLFQNWSRSGTYLMLANYLVKRLLPRSGLTIAEDRRMKSSCCFYLLQWSISFQLLVPIRRYWKLVILRFFWLVIRSMSYPHSFIELCTCPLRISLPCLLYAVQLMMVVSVLVLQTFLKKLPGLMWCSSTG